MFQTAPVPSECRGVERRIDHAEDAASESQAREGTAGPTLHEAGITFLAKLDTFLPKLQFWVKTLRRIIVEENTVDYKLTKN